MSTLSGFPSINGVATLLPPPEGYKVNFNNPQRQYETEMYSVAAVGNLLMLLFLSQRLYTKIFLTKGLQLDDGMFVGSASMHISLLKWIVVDNIHIGFLVISYVRLLSSRFRDERECARHILKED